MTETADAEISVFSRRSLQVDVIGKSGRVLSVATAFLFIYNGARFLVTNLHVVTGINQDTGNPLGRFDDWPIQLRLTHPNESRRAPNSFSIELYGSDERTLFSAADPLHADIFPNADVAVLRLPKFENWLPDKYFYEFTEPEYPLQITDTLFIVGYPGHARLQRGAPPVWTRGSVASEPNMSGGRAPLLVDARTREGQSGSPVIAYRRAMTLTGEGGFTEQRAEAAVLIGVYSGRTDNDSDLGRVWSPEFIRQAIFY